MPIPDGLAFELAAAAPGALLTAALLITDFGRLRAGETVLVHSAAGGVGHPAVQLARLVGAGLLLGTVGEVGRKESAERAGYDQVAVRGPELARAILAATNGRGSTSSSTPQGTSLLDVDLEIAAPSGRVVLFGNATGAPLGALPALDKLMRGNLFLAGFSLAALAATDPARVSAALRRSAAR